MIDQNHDADAPEKIMRKWKLSSDEADKLTIWLIILLISHLVILVHTIIVTQIFWGRAGLILLDLVVIVAVIFTLVDIQKLRKIQEK